MAQNRLLSMTAAGMSIDRHCWPALYPDRLDVGMT